MSDNKRKGNRSEGALAAAFLRKGYTVLFPFGECERYDMVIDRGRGFERVQIKTGRRVKNRSCVAFNACSSLAHHGNGCGRRDYRGQIELFGVFCEETGITYVVPVEQVGRRQGSLRLAPSRNGQHKKIMWAKDFEI